MGPGNNEFMLNKQMTEEGCAPTEQNNAWSAETTSALTHPGKEEHILKDCRYI